MGCTGWGGDEDVIEINETIRKMAKNPVHESLEGLCRVAEAERHPKELEQAEGCDDGGLGDVLGVHGHLEVTFGEVEFAEDVTAMEICRKILDIGEWIAIMLGVVVQSAVIAAGAP